MKSRRSSQRNRKESNRRRRGYVEDWDQYFHGLAVQASRKSKDPKCPVGAVIVSQDEVVISTGFNGFARGVFDDKELLTDVKEKLRWICHAEANAISNAARTGVSTKGSTIYTTKFPCLNCCNSIAQAGIKRIYTLDDKYWGDDQVDGNKVPRPHSRKPALLKQADIRVDAPFHRDFNSRWRFSTNGRRGTKTRRRSKAVSAAARANLARAARNGSPNGKKRSLV